MTKFVVVPTTCSVYPCASTSTGSPPHEIVIGVGAACAGAHAGTIRVKHTLRPLGVAMAARDVYDPYKDCARRAARSSA